MASTARALIFQAVFPRPVRHSTSSQTTSTLHPIWGNYSNAVHVRSLALATHKAAMRSDCASILLFLGRSVTHQQCRPQLSKSSSSATVGQEAVVPYAHQSLGQDVQQEPSNKLLAAQGHLSGSRTLAVVLVTEGHTLLVYLTQACVADGDPAGVARQIIDHAAGVLQAVFAVYDPFGSHQAVQ